MYDFMEYCLKQFYQSSHWNEENQYSNLCSWSRALLNFHTPKGLSLIVSKLPTPHFKPSYTLTALPTLNGSLGYLYTSQSLDIGTSATRIHQKNPSSHSLLYGRMFFPGARMEAMYVRRISQHSQYLITAVNSPKSIPQN
ncbi:unnamed protein product [Rhizopus stolonifer]